MTVAAKKMELGTSHVVEDADALLMASTPLSYAVTTVSTSRSTSTELTHPCFSDTEKRQFLHGVSQSL